MSFRSWFKDEDSLKAFAKARLEEVPEAHLNIIKKETATTLEHFAEYGWPLCARSITDEVSFQILGYHLHDVIILMSLMQDSEIDYEFPRKNSRLYVPNAETIYMNYKTGKLVVEPSAKKRSLKFLQRHEIIGRL